MPGLDDISVLMLWTAVAIYVLAFVAYAIDLARRSEVASDAKLRAEAEMVGAGRKGTAAGVKSAQDAAAPGYEFARIGTSLTVLAFVLHLGATITRGIAAERVPWANNYEFAMTGTLLIIAVYLAVLVRVDLRFLGTFIVGLVVTLVGTSAVSFYVEVTPLADPLKSTWLVIHVFVASLATAFLAIAFALSVTQLMQLRRQRLLSEGAAKTGPKFLRTLPNPDTLEGMAYRFTTIGFIFWTFSLIAGAIWANDAWSRYWGFDVKETWTFIIWVLYAGYIHARATRGWRGAPSAWLSIVGFSAVIFNFTIVNVFFKGLHAYSGIS